MTTTLTKTISAARPVDPTLDFEVLRAEGIAHLERLATEIWTDYNAHDPGITLLEALCYAITDLGYRAQMLPIEDLMAAGPESKKAWFGAFEILPNAPVTELDFRKLLIDVDGVRNAWLEKGIDRAQPIGSLGVVFPIFSDEKGAIDAGKLRVFLAEKGLPAFDDVDFKKLVAHIPAYFSNIEVPPAIRKMHAVIDALPKGLLVKELLRSALPASAEPHLEAIFEFLEGKTSPAGLALALAPSDFEDFVEAFSNEKPQAKAVEKHIEKLKKDDDFKKLFEANLEHRQLFDAFLKSGNKSGFQTKDENGKTVWLDEFIYLQNEVEDLDKKRLQIGPDAKPTEYLELEAFALFHLKNLPKTTDSKFWDGEKAFLQKLETFVAGDFKAFKSFETALEKLYADPKKSVSRLALERFLGANFSFEGDDKSKKIEAAAEALEQYFAFQTGKDLTQFAEVTAFLQAHFCQFGLLGLRRLDEKDHPNAAIALNGLYKITLDLDDGADETATIDRALGRLHAQRGLCEDFLPPVALQKRPIRVCLRLETDPAFDEESVAAEAIWKMQAHLSPAPRFRDFSAMAALSKSRDGSASAEKIIEGPLLDQGFLDDRETREAVRRDRFFLSDLLALVLETPGVLGVSSLKINPAPELASSDFEEKTFFDAQVGDFFDVPSKAVIDVCASCFEVQKGTRSVKIDGCAVQKKLEHFALVEASALPDERGGPTVPSGFFRADLAEYRSVQFELPAIYRVGEHRPLPSATAADRAKARHLQAFLAFFDQILASYLAQLGRMRQLLAVDQDPSEPTRSLPSMLDLPGVRELIEAKASFRAQPEDWPPTALLPAPEAEQRAVFDLLEAENWLGDPADFVGFDDFRARLESALGSPLFEKHGAFFADHFWEKFVADPANSHAKALGEAAEDGATQQKRSNSALDHAIALFGEHFSDWVAALLRPDAEPEDNAQRLNFDEYLQRKSQFLREIAALGADRSRGYDYRKMDAARDLPDVWNSPNVAGLHRRAARLVGFEPIEAATSLVAEPVFRLDAKRKAGEEGAVAWFVQFRIRPEMLHLWAENPRRALPWMESPPFATREKAQEAIRLLEFRLADPGGRARFEVKNEAQKFRAEISIQDEKGAWHRLLLGLPTSRDEAADLLREVKTLVSDASEREGFHLLEHILLRPNDPKDRLLELSLGCRPEKTPVDPYSFWLSVIAPANGGRLGDLDFRRFFEQTLRTEAPAHLAVRFCYLEREPLERFEAALKNWMFAKARCRPDDCDVTATANALIELLQNQNCPCDCDDGPSAATCC